MLIVARPRCRSALSGSVIEVRRVGLGVGSTKASVATSAIVISTVTPKNGPRQLMPPSSPPTSGPSAMPMPSAVSYRMIAPWNPPEAAPTITASEVAMNRALPRPQPARKPMIPPMLPAAPAAALNATIRMRPATSVRLPPIRLDTPPGHRGDHQVAGEQQLDRARRGLQLLGQRGQDRVDQPDAHERDHAGERDRPDRLGLAERACR